MLKINEDNIIKHKKDLENEDDLIPLILLIYIDNFKYINNLKKKNLFYGQIQEEMFNRRNKFQFMSINDALNFEEEELKNYVKKHKEYKDILL